MKVLLSSHGSTGDIYPLIALGVALNAAGHPTTFATGSLHRETIEKAGLRFSPLPPDQTPDEAAAWMARVQSRRTPLGQLREIYRAARPHLRETIERLESLLDAHDLSVFSYLFPFHGQLARDRGVPAVCIAFAHNCVPSLERPPAGFPPLSLLPRQLRTIACRALWKTADRSIDTAVNRIFGSAPGGRSLPRSRHFFSRPADLVLVAVSRALMPPGEIPPDRFRFIGYCRWQPTSGPADDTDPIAFCEGEPVPVISFGSMTDRNPARTMETLAGHWPRGRKLLVQSGWAGFQQPADAPHIRVIGKMPHDRLFAYASAVIHHGGSGVTASALQAGKPQLIVPHIADQNFFGKEMERLGAGRRVSRHRWPRHLAGAVDALLADPNIKGRAEELQSVLRAENGPAEAVREIEAFARNYRRPAVKT